MIYLVPGNAFPKILILLQQHTVTARGKTNKKGTRGVLRVSLSRSLGPTDSELGSLGGIDTDVCV